MHTPTCRVNPEGQPMSGAAKLAWVLGGGLVLVVAGVGIAAAYSKPKGGSGFLELITDPTSVKQYQTMLASGLSDITPQNPNPNVPGLTSASYGPSDIDGNPQNARWVAALATFQKDINQAWAIDMKNGNPGIRPAGYPLFLRTDGALDYATAIALVNA